MSRRPLLLVDDEPRILESLENNLGMQYEVSTAQSGWDGLAILADRPHAVVISDMRMPGMNGAEFLARARQLQPDIVSMLLTGHADLEDAAEAVNRGELFRLLLKPCETTRMLGAVEDAYRHFELLQAERTLLEHTLQGAVGVLTDILALAQPAAYGRASRVAAIVRHVAGALHLAQRWQVELAAMLSQLGCVDLDTALLERFDLGQLSPQDAATYRAHPAAARKMLERIPRLEEVAVLVGDQLECTSEHRSETTRLGCQLLRMALLIDGERARAQSWEAAVDRVLATGHWDPALTPPLRSFHASTERRRARVQGSELAAGMVLEVDAVSPQGALWMARGTELTHVAAKRLRALHERGLLVSPLFASVP